MRIHVSYFGIIADMANRKEETVTLDAPATMGNLIDALVSTNPRFAAIARQVRSVANGKHAGRDTPLQDGDEVALMRAIGGGS